MITEAWYTVNTKPHRESQVESYLRSQGILTYFPTFDVHPVNPRSSRLRPYFPGYIFARVDLEEIGISAINWIPGAVGIVQFGGQAAVLDDVVIEEMRARIRANQLRDTKSEAFQPGDKIIVQKGVFAGSEAIFDTGLKQQSTGSNSGSFSWAHGQSPCQ